MKFKIDEKVKTKKFGIRGTIIRIEEDNNELFYVIRVLYDTDFSYYREHELEKGWD